MLVLWAVAEDSIVALLFCTERTLDSKNVISENDKPEENKSSLFVMYITEEIQNIMEEWKMLRCQKASSSVSLMQNFLGSKVWECQLQITTSVQQW